MTPILAIDPGASGGFAWVNRDGQVFCAPMPETTGDVHLLIRETWADNPGMLAVIEKVGGFMGQGTNADGERRENPAAAHTMFNFGFSVGTLHGILMGIGMSFELVTPQKWQKPFQFGKKGGMGRTEWKNKLKAEAQRRFPDLGRRITLKTADALLILAYRMAESERTQEIPFF